MDSLIQFGPWTDGNTVSVILTSSAPCATVGGDTAIAIIDTTAGGAPSVSITQLPGSPVCDGDLIRFEATPSGGGGSPSYEWFVDGAPQFVDSAVFETTLLAAGSPYSVSVQLTSSASCVSPNTATDDVQVTVTNSVSPSVSIVANPNGPVCPGENVDFEANLVGEGSNPVINWFVNGVLQGLGPSFTYGPAPGPGTDSISVELVSSASCAITDTVLDFYILQIQSNVPAEVSISQNPNNPVCNGDDVEFTASATGGGTAPQFDWYLNGGLQQSGVNLDIITIPGIKDMDVVAVVMTSSNPPGCTSPNSDSDTVFIQGSSSVPLFVEIVQSPAGDLCIGQTVTYTANITGGGVNPSYQWNVIPPGGAPISNLSSITLTTVASGGAMNPFEIEEGNNLITLNLTADPNSCNSGDSYLAFQTTEVSSAVAPMVSLSQTPANPVCLGDNVSFTTTVSGEGTSPVYNWYENNSLVATNSTGTYNSNSLQDSAVVVVELVSNGCGASPTAYDTLVIDIQTPIIPTVDIEVTPGTQVCDGGALRFVALATGQGDNPSYRWFEGTNFFGNGDTIIRTFTSPGPYQIAVMLKKDLACGAGPSIVYDTVDITINPTPQVTVSQNPDTTCNGDLVNLESEVLGFGFGSQYVWRRLTAPSGIVAAGADLTSVQVTASNGDQFRLTVINPSTCGPDSLFDDITIIGAGSVTPSVTIDMTPINPICPQEVITLRVGSQSGQGANPSYRWYVNGGLKDIDSVYTTNELDDFDSVSVVLTSSASCATTPTASDHIIIREIDSTVTIIGDTLFCYGSDSVLLVSNDSSIGSNYYWIETVSGDTVGFSDSIYVDTTGFYAVTVYNGRGCPETSRTIEVQAPLPYGDTIIAANVDSCFGETIELSTVGSSIDANYSLSWLYGLDTIAGAHDSTFNAPWTGVYYLEASNSACSDTVGPAIITIQPRIDSLLSIVRGDSILCEDDTVFLKVPAIQGNAVAGKTGLVNTNVAGIAGPGSRTVEAWVKTDTDMTILTWGTGAGLYSVRVQADGRVRLQAGGGGSVVTNTATVDDNNYHHVSVVYDSAGGANLSGVKIYVDGVDEAVIAAPLGVTSGSQNIQIGTAAGAGNSIIDELRVWTTALDSASIAHNRLTPLSGSEPNLYGLWNFEDTAGSTVKNAVDATVGGVANIGIDSGFYRAPLSAPRYRWIDTVNSIVLQDSTINYFAYDTTVSLVVRINNGSCESYSNQIDLREVIFDDSLNLLLGNGQPLSIGCFGDSVAFESRETDPGVVYQWFYGWDSIPGATNQSYGSTKTGIYTVRLTKEGCTKASRSQAIRNAPDYDGTVTYDTDTICEDGSVELVVNSVNTNAWTTTGTGYGENSNVLSTLDRRGFSIEMSFKIDDLGALPSSVLLNKYQNTVDFIRVGFNVSGDLYFESDASLNGAGTDILPLPGSSSNWNTTDWFHVAIVWDSLRGKAIYLNGIDTAFDRTETIVMADNGIGACQLIVGSNRSGPGACAVDNSSEFPGKIDEVRIWDSPHPRVFFLNNRFVPLTGQEQGLIALWQMDSIGTFDDGDLIGDASGNLNPLQLRNNGHEFAKGGFYMPDNTPSYQWYDQNGILTGEQSDTLVVVAEGSYYAEVLNGSSPATCTHFSDTIDIRVNTLNDSLFFDLVHDTVFCDDTDSAKVWVEANLGMTVEWFDSIANVLVATGDTAWFDTSGVYFAVLIKPYTEFDGDTIWCTDTTRTFEVFELENPRAFAGYDTLICFEDRLLWLKFAFHF